MFNGNHYFSKRYFDNKGSSSTYDDLRIRTKFSTVLALDEGNPQGVMWFPSQKATDAVIWCSREQPVEKTVKLLAH